MSIEQYAYLGEIVAAVAVIASLIYVARQLAQTATTMRVSGASERLERDYEIVLPLIENREFAEIWLKAGDDFASLDDVDQQRVLFFERRAIMLWHHTFQLRKQSLLQDAIWKEQIWVIKNIGRRQPVREAWKLFRGAFEQDFQEFVDVQFSDADIDRAEGSSSYE